MNALVTTGSQDNYYQRVTYLLDNDRSLSDGTKHQYGRVMQRAHAAGVDVFNSDSLREFMMTIGESVTPFASAALVRYYEDYEDRLRTTPTANADDRRQKDDLLDLLVTLKKQVRQMAKGRGKNGQKAHCWLSVQDVGRLIRAPYGRLAHRDRIALIILLNSGLRRAEAISLKWRDLVQTGDGYQLSVEAGKGDKARAIPLTHAMVDELLSWKKWCKAGDDDNVLRGFRSTKLTDSITGAQLYNICRKWGKEISKPKLAPHDLRRTYAMQLYNQDVKTEVISLLLGHESVETTIRYLNVKVTPDAVVHFPLD